MFAPDQRFSTELPVVMTSSSLHSLAEVTAFFVAAARLAARESVAALANYADVLADPVLGRALFLLAHDFGPATIEAMIDEETDGAPSLTQQIGLCAVVGIWQGDESETLALKLAVTATGGWGPQWPGSPDRRGRRPASFRAGVTGRATLGRRLGGPAGCGCVRSRRPLTPRPLYQSCHCA